MGKPAPCYNDEAMDNVYIRECDYQDLESIQQLDQLWDGENVSYVFIYENPEQFYGNFERFRKYFLARIAPKSC